MKQEVEGVFSGIWKSDRIRSSFILIFIALFHCSVSLAQEIPVGTWRTHFNYTKTDAITLAEDIIYAGSQFGLVKFDCEDNSLQKFSQIDGLAENDITALGSDPGRNQLLIGYRSGNIDVLRNNQIINLDLISNSQIQGPRTINHFQILGPFAYISTSFGLLKFDLDRLLVTETYREIGTINDQPSPLEVFQSTFFNDSLFLATEQGVLAAPPNSGVNLFDNSNWKNFEGELPSGVARAIVSFQNQIFTYLENEDLFSYSGEQWNSTALFTLATVDYISSSTSEILVVEAGNAYRVNSSLEKELIAEGVNQIVADNNEYWYTSNIASITRISSTVQESFSPNGPTIELPSALSAFDDQVIALPGGYEGQLFPLNIPAAYDQFNNGQWQVNLIIDFQRINDAIDLVNLPGSNDYYMATIGNGLVKVDQQGAITVIDENTDQSPLLNYNNRGVLIPDLERDKNGVWVLNYGFQIIHYLSSNGEWSSYTIPNSSAAFAEEVVSIDGLLFLRIGSQGGGGVVAFNPNTGDTRRLTSTVNQGGLASNEVFTIAKDDNGYLWIGTSRGVSVLLNTFSVFSGAVDAIEPIFDNRQLLIEEEVLKITVDQGNRKWMGTTNGLWLFDEEAERQINYFNTDNSPLPSNIVNDIAILDKTGEVFIASENGLVSYRGTATTPKPTNNNVTIFPNPVTRNFTGTIGISGLVNNADVKITDAGGRLIWQTTAAGGTAIWNARGYDGNRAATGVYLVFISSQDGNETLVGKIAIVN